MGVVGWMIGGGYGSFSKMFGTGPANLLEAKVVTANGEVVIANMCQNSESFFSERFDLKEPLRFCIENCKSSFI